MFVPLLPALTPLFLTRTFTAPVLRARSLSSPTDSSHVSDITEEAPRSQIPLPSSSSLRNPVIQGDVATSSHTLLRSQTAPASPEVLDTKFDPTEDDSRLSRLWSSLKRGVSLRGQQRGMNNKGKAQERSPDMRGLEEGKLKLTWSRFSTLSRADKKEKADTSSSWKEFKEGRAPFLWFPCRLY
jgi:hypothetical protein